MGLPSFIGWKKKESFDNTKQRVWKKLQGWEGKLLSQARREVLIKAVAQALPTYIMSCFKLPIGLCHEIEALIKKFFWGQRGEGRKVHWLKWEELCKSKSPGVWVLRIYLCSMMLYWRNRHGGSYITKHLCFIGCLSPNTFQTVQSWMQANPSFASYAWRSIIWGREVIKK